MAVLLNIPALVSIFSHTKGEEIIEQLGGQAKKQKDEKRCPQ